MGLELMPIIFYPRYLVLDSNPILRDREIDSGRNITTLLTYGSLESGYIVPNSELMRKWKYQCLVNVDITDEV